MGGVRRPKPERFELCEPHGNMLARSERPIACLQTRFPLPKGGKAMRAFQCYAAQIFRFVAVLLFAHGLVIAPLVQAQETVIPASVGGVLPAASNIGFVQGTAGTVGTAGAATISVPVSIFARVAGQ